VNKMYNEEWIEYYQYLEVLRESGVTNMFGASTYLVEDFGLKSREARKILVSWMENYDTLIEKEIITRGE
tara:strand:- start:2432 stop:2641 length:210 start_codon:yes stop_codon:yes gene_type:complete